MEFVPNTRNDIDSWKEVQLVYNSALKEIGTKLEILNDEFQHVHQYNPIEHIKTRVKTPESIVKKLKRYGYETSIENMVKYINDIAGVRLICSFTSDIYRLAEMIGNQSDLKVLSIKDYIKNPKESGYKSYHMLVSVPIFLSDSVVDTKVEIQIRTIAMDFWASLEHKIYYKFEGNAPKYISKDLQECAKMVSELDDKMLSLNEAIRECIAQQDKDQIRMNEELMNDVCRDVLGNNKEYAETFGDTNIIKAVRNIVGLDKNVVSDIFYKYINDNRLNMKQIQFVKLLIDYVIKNGTIDMQKLTEQPFKNVGEVYDLFGNNIDLFKEIREDIESINENAEKLA